MAIGTPFHERTAPLNRSLAWRTWSGYHAATCYNDYHQPEYAAIRNSAALTLEVTVDYARKTVPAQVVDLPFFRPARMRATP